MNNLKYSVEKLETQGVRCKFYSMGELRDGWIMPDGFGVDYAGFVQIQFEPKTIKTDDTKGLFFARRAVAEQCFVESRNGLVDAGEWFGEGKSLTKIAYMPQANKRLQFETTVSFMDGSAASITATVFNVTSALDEDSEWTPLYTKWRHGGWYTNVRYPDGASGCVSNNYEDKQWRIACDSRRLSMGEPGDFTYKSRDAAARAERALIRLLVLDIQANRGNVKAANFD